VLNTEIEFKRGILFVRLIGEVNLRTLNTLNINVSDIITKAGIKYMVLNMEKAKLEDSINFDESIDGFENNLGIDGKLFICGYTNENNLSRKIKELYNARTEINALNLINI